MTCLGVGPLGGMFWAELQGTTTPTQASPRSASALPVAPHLVDRSHQVQPACALWAAMTASCEGLPCEASRRHDDLVLAPEVLWSLVVSTGCDSYLLSLGVRCGAQEGMGGGRVFHTPFTLATSSGAFPQFLVWIREF